MKIIRAKINIDSITKPLVNTGDQAGWLKNHDNCTQGERLETAAPGWDCPRGPGCDLCFTRAMMLISKRDGVEMSKVRPLPECLLKPSGWKKRKNVFFSPTGDLFHDNIPKEYVHEVLSMFGDYPQHNFIGTTKRPHNLHWISEFTELRNVYVGVSVEAQKYLSRVDALLELPNNFYKILFLAPMITHIDLSKRILQGVDWIICTPERGGQGRVPRPCKEEWLKDLIKQIKSFDPNLPLFLDMPYQEKRVDRIGKYTEALSFLFE